LHYFLGIKTIEKRLKIGCTVPGRIRPAVTMHDLMACHVRPTRRPVGPWPGDSVQPQRRPAWPFRCVRAGRAGAWSPRGRWWLASGKVLPASSRGPLRGHRAMRAEAGLTQTAARRWGSGAVLRGGVRRRWSWHDACRRRGPSPAPWGFREEGEVGIKEGRIGAG
jgi:hypothetical protein